MRINKLLKIFPAIAAVTLVTPIVASCAKQDVKKFKVTFDPNHEGSELKTVEVEEGKKCTAPTIPEYGTLSFKHWSLDGEEFDFDTPINKDITLKGEWEFKKPKGEYVTYKESDEPYNPEKPYIKGFNPPDALEAQPFTDETEATETYFDNMRSVESVSIIINDYLNEWFGEGTPRHYPFCTFNLSVYSAYLKESKIYVTIEYSMIFDTPEDVVVRSEEHVTMHIPLIVKAYAGSEGGIEGKLYLTSALSQDEMATNEEWNFSFTNTDVYENGHVEQTGAMDITCEDKKSTDAKRLAFYNGALKVLSTYEYVDSDSYTGFKYDSYYLSNCSIGQEI